MPSSNPARRSRSTTTSVGGRATRGYYISRYPAGRESTINYDTIDVAAYNDSPHGILVKTSYTDTSITVTFYSSAWADGSDEVEEYFHRYQPENEEEDD